MGQVRVLFERVAELARRHGGAPAVVTGDFNATPSSHVYDFIRSGKAELRELDRARMSGQLTTSSPGSDFAPAGGGPRAAYAQHSPPPPPPPRGGWEEEELLVATGRPGSTVATHPLKLRSSYAHARITQKGEQGEPALTSYHRKFWGTVDYIWHTEGIRPVRVLDMVPSHVLLRCGGLPSPSFPSDHLSLAADFRFPA